MVLNRLITNVSDHVRVHGVWGQPCVTGVEELFLVSNTSPTRCEAMLYEPVLCLVLQGRKEAYLGDRRIDYGAGELIVVSHAVPVIAGVTEATPETPYVAMVLKLDLALLRSLYDEIGGADLAEEEASPIQVAETEAALLDAMGRLFDISRTPLEVQALAPLVQREIHFRLLRARHGAMLRQLLRHESPASRISRAIARIREDFRTALPVADLAAIAGMSTSAFHEHFKTLTSTTPLQYQKDLRLLEARRLLTMAQTSVSTAAYEVGYESPTQFSREYTRKFGISPREDKAGASAGEDALP